MEQVIMINRRQMLALTGGIAAVAAVAPVFSFARASDGFFEITAGPAKKKLYTDGDVEADLWAYNASNPGPEIRVKAGERVKVRLINNLEEPTSIHWHGIRIQNDMDGVAGLTQDPVPPGGTFEYDFVVPDAGTYWYHAHNRSWNQVARGLYGSLIVEEVEPAFDRDHDITVVIDDWRLRDDGNLDLESLGNLMDWSHAGRLGNYLTVNGDSAPVFPLKRGEAYRVRLINVANARVMEIGADGAEGSILAYDGQTLPEPETIPSDPLLIGPAQRMDLLIRADKDFPLQLVTRGDRFSFAEFSVKDNEGAAVAEVKLPTAGTLPEPDLSSASTYTLEMTGGAMGQFVETRYNGKVLEGEDFRRTGQVWAFNGVANLSDTPFFTAKQGETIVVDVRNETSFVHAMHTHGHHFRVVEREGSTVDESARWRDTFLIGPSQKVRIAFVADNPGKWLFHCHMLEHAAAGMNTWFEVA